MLGASATSAVPARIPASPTRKVGFETSFLAVTTRSKLAGAVTDPSSLNSDEHEGDCTATVSVSPKEDTLATLST